MWQAWLPQPKKGFWEPLRPDKIPNVSIPEGDFSLLNQFETSAKVSRKIVLIISKNKFNILK
jgi:hypothetical protein